MKDNKKGNMRNKRKTSKFMLKYLDRFDDLINQASKERDKERDMAAYKRLRSEGIQPKGIDGAAKMEREALTTHEIKAGTLLEGPKSEKKRKERALNDVLGSN